MHRQREQKSKLRTINGMKKIVEGVRLSLMTRETKPRIGSNRERTRRTVQEGEGNVPRKK